MVDQKKKRLYLFSFSHLPLSYLTFLCQMPLKTESHVPAIGKMWISQNVIWTHHICMCLQCFIQG